MLSDLKFTFRQFAKAPGFFAVAVLILALGIAANTAVFTVIDALLLRGLPVRHPEELVVATAKGFNEPASLPVFEQFRDSAKTLSGVAGFTGSPRSIVPVGFGRSGVVRAFTSVVSGNFFSLLGTPPLLGRTLTVADDRRDAPLAVAVISYGFWQREFGSDPAVLGKSILIDNVPFSIVGVAARSFAGVQLEYPVDLWVPLQMEPILTPSDSVRFHPSTASGHYWLWIIGRLHDGSTLEGAEAELSVIFTRELVKGGATASLLQKYGIGRISLSPGGSGYIANREKVKSLLDILLIVVGMVLVVACANVASLLLARMNARRREFAVRAALGASRWRLIRQFLAEGLALGGLSGAIGLILTHWGTRMLARYLPGGAGLDLALDGRVLSFAVGVSVCTGGVVGLLPALRFSSLDLITAVKSQSSAVTVSSGEKLSQLLVAAQIAVSICLLAGAGLFIRTLQNLKNVDVGFNPHHLLIVQLQFDPKSDDQHRINVSRDLWLAIQSQPGMRDATFSWSGGGLMTHEGDFPLSFTVDGYVPSQGELVPTAHGIYVGPDFFRTLGVPLVRGKGFGLGDIFPLAGGKPDDPAEIVINESLATKYFGRTDPLGHLIRIPGGPAAPAYRVIGVARDTKQVNLRDESVLQFYAPCTAFRRLPGILPPPVVVLEMRTSSDLQPVILSLQTRANAIDPKLHVILSTTADQSVDQSIFQERMMAETAGSLSVFALLLASLGLYGALAYNVTQRTREIGVRMALGARPASIVRLVLKRGMGLTAIGCVAGIVAAICLSHLIASRLYGVAATDASTLAVTALVLLAVALLACWLPARRATRVDPMIALRAE